MLTHVQIVHVPVSDQDVAHDFHVRRLGLAIVADLEMGPHGRWPQVAPDDAATTLALVPGDEETPAGSLRGLVFETSDMDGDLTMLSERGVDVSEGIVEMPWARMARLRDPDGSELLLQTPTVAHD